MNDTLKKEKVQPFHIPVQFSALVKIVVFLVAAVLSGGLAAARERRGGQKKAAKELRHMTPLYKSTSCHR